MKKGAKVRVIPPQPIVGTVIERRINPGTDCEELLIEWTESGEPTRAWFDADKLEEVQA